MILLGFAHVHVSEREVAHQSPCGFDDSSYEDCLWCSTIEYLRASGHPEIPATHAEAEALRCASGEPPTGSSNMIDVRRGVKARYGLDLQGVVLGAGAIWTAMVPGKVAVVQGAGSHWQAGFTGGHAVAAFRLDTNDRVWMCDPLAPTQYRDSQGVVREYNGEWQTKAQFQSYISGLVGAGAIVSSVVPSTGGAMLDFDILEPAIGEITVPGGGHAYIILATGQHVAVAGGYTNSHCTAKIKLRAPLDTNPGDRQTGYLVGVNAAFFLASDVVFKESGAEYEEGYADAKARASAAVGAI